VIRFFDGKVSEQKLAGFSFFLHTQELWQPFEICIGECW
jgi:hypothetical protein